MRQYTRLRPLGLRARLTLSFALGALLLSALLSLLTWNLTRESLLRQREDASIERVLANALTLRRSLGGTTDVASLLASLPTPSGAELALLSGGTWDARNPVEFAQSDVPAELIEQVAAGDAATVRTVVGDTTYQITGVPIPTLGAQYFEAVSLTDISQALDGLTISLLGASAVTTVAGGLVGFWASRRVLEPLRNVGLAAEAIAGGQLDTRLASGDDRDLDPLVASFNDMASALEERIERDTRFASEVSHELRSPLMTVAASMEVLENSRNQLGERGQKALDLMGADLERFRQLVEDLLEISRVDVGAVTLHLAPVLAAELVVQAVGATGRGDVPVRCGLEVDNAVVLVDKVRFFRVIDNLLANAANYAGGATGVEVLLHTDDEGTGWVRVAVEDAGSGVPADERGVIFDRFSRGREGGNRGADSGTGLGLALVAEHVRLHHGRVWVEDRPDGHAGARFVVELPALDDEHAVEGDGTYLGDDYGLDEVIGPPAGGPPTADADDSAIAASTVDPTASDDDGSGPLSRRHSAPAPAASGTTGPGGEPSASAGPGASGRQPADADQELTS